LFSDLVHTTESLKNYKTSEALRGGDDGSGGGGEGGGGDGGGPSSRKIDEYVEAYRADNAKLVKEVSSRTLYLSSRAHVINCGLVGWL
jgi:hypothetical protein